LAIILPPRRDEPLAEDGFPVLRLSVFFEEMSSEVNALSDIASTPSDSDAVIAQQNASILKLNKRVSDLEASNDSDALNFRLTKVASDLKRLIKDLINAVKALDTTQLASEALCVQEKIFKESKLLSQRFEEAVESGITEQDTE